jgi:Tfp pilus assembly protein PilN
MSQQINLFNPIFLKQKKIFSARTMAQALGIIVLGLCVLTGLAAWQVYRLSRDIATSEARFRAEEARMNEARAALSQRKASAAMEQEVRALEQEVALREAVLRLMEGNALGEVTGAGVYLRALARQHLQGLWLTAVELEGGELNLAGRALSAELVPEYLRRLGEEEVLRGRRFATFQMERPVATDKEAPRYIEFVLRSRPPREAP